MKFAKLGLALAASLMFVAAPALAAPLAYQNSPFSTPQELANGVITAINAGMPTAATNQTATGSAGASTLNGTRGTITTEALSTAAGGTFTETITNSSITAASQVFVTIGNGTNSAGQPALATVTPAAGSVVLKIQNIHASAALNGTLAIGFLVVN
jgi:hypothetical protein